MKNGLTIVYTGNGKGKTTAALGLAMRAVGQKLKVVMIQFIKGNRHCGEHSAADNIEIEIFSVGEGFTWKTDNKEQGKQKAKEAFEFSSSLLHSGRYDMVILDEINNVVDYGYLTIESVTDLIKNKPVSLHLVLTGRNAHKNIISLADIVTEMKEIKHSFNMDVKAQKGIEF